MDTDTQCIKTSMSDGTPPTIPELGNSARNATNRLDAAKKTQSTATTKARCVRSAPSHITTQAQRMVRRMGRQSHKATERLKHLASMSREDAIKAMMDERTNALKRWYPKCHHRTTHTVNGIGMWICDLCRCDNTPNDRTELRLPGNAATTTPKP